jgi:hypothetical protein
MNLTYNGYLKSSAAYDAYFIHIYEVLCAAAEDSDDHELRLGDIAHGEVLDIILRLQSDRGSQQEILASLNWQSAKGQRMIRLAAALLLPFNFNGIGGWRSGPAVEWNQTESVEDIVSHHLQQLLPVQHPSTLVRTICNACASHTRCILCNMVVPLEAPRRVPKLDLTENSSFKFSRTFSAYKLKYVAGFKIVWTSNILEHLKLVDAESGKTKVFLFHHTKILDHHLGLLK